jgi:hypothetical protein
MCYTDTKSFPVAALLGPDPYPTPHSGPLDSRYLYLSTCIDLCPMLLQVEIAVNNDGGGSKPRRSMAWVAIDRRNRD